MVESSSSSPQDQSLPNAPVGNRGNRIKKVLWRFGIFAVALLSALFAGVPILPFALELPVSVVFPLALIIATLFAAISASWVGTLLAPDHTRTRLLLVVGISIATAAVIALIVALGEVLVNPAMLRSPAIMAIIATLDIFILLAPLLIVLLSASWATWHFRSPRGRMGRETKLTLGLAFAVFCVELFFMFSFYGGLSVAIWVSIASVALGLTLATWRFRRRRDWLGMDAAMTLCLVGLAPLIIAATSYFSDLLGLLP